MKHLRILLLVLLCACGKEGKTPTPIPPVEIKPDFSISKAEALPLEVITISLATPSTATSLKGKIGASDFEAFRMDNGCYAFFIPEMLTEGSYELSITGGKKALPFKVGKAPVIADPVKYNNDFLTEIDELTELIKSSQGSLVKNGYATAEESQASLAGFKATIENFQKELAKASPAEVKTAAAFIAARRAQIDSVFQGAMELSENSILTGRANNNLRRNDSDADFEQVFKAAEKTFVTELPQTAATLAALSLAIQQRDWLKVGSLQIELWAKVLLVKLGLSKLFALKVVEDTERGGFQTNAKESKAFENSQLRKIVARIFTRTVTKEDLENSDDAAKRNLGSGLTTLQGQLSADGIAEYIDVDVLKFRPQRGETPLVNRDKLSVSVLNNTAVKAAISNFTKDSFDLSFFTEDPSATFDYIISYLLGDKPVTETVTGNTITGTAALSLSAVDGVPFTSPGEVGNMYHFEVKGYTAKPTTNYKWSFGDGVVVNAKGNNFEFHSYDKPGNYPVSVTVTEGATIIGTVSKQATITDKETYFISTADGIPLTKAGEMNKSYTFTVQGATWRASSKSTVVWNFGDGSLDEQMHGTGSVRHVFSKEGTFTVKARVFAEDGALDEHVAQAMAVIGSGQVRGEYFFNFDFAGNKMTFPSDGVHASFLGGRFDIVGDSLRLQTGIFFSPASLFQGVGTYTFMFNCQSSGEGSTAIGAHLYSFATLAALASTHSKFALWGCPPKMTEVSVPNGQVTITAYDNKVVEGTFFYTDVVTGLPVLNGKFKVPLR